MTDMDELQLENFEEIDDSQWWDMWSETEYAWELDSGIYDPPVIWE